MGGLTFQYQLFNVSNELTYQLEVNYINKFSMNFMGADRVIWIRNPLVLTSLKNKCQNLSQTFVIVLPVITTSINKTNSQIWNTVIFPKKNFCNAVKNNFSSKTDYFTSNFLKNLVKLKIYLKIIIWMIFVQALKLASYGQTWCFEQA